MQLFVYSLIPHICALIWDLPWGRITLQWKLHDVGAALGCSFLGAGALGK